jgi:hypothetical protein
MAERIWTSPRLFKTLRGNKDKAARMERLARKYVGYLFDQLRPRQTYKFQTWQLADGSRIKAHVRRDVLGERARIEIFAPLIAQLEIVTCYVSHGLWVTNAYQQVPDEYYGELWVGRNHSRKDPIITASIAPAAIEKITTRIPGLNDLSAIYTETYLNKTTAGLNFRQPTRYSGRMRKYVQFLIGAGKRANFGFSWADSTGIISDPDNSVSGLWLIRIRTDGVWAKKVPFTDCKLDKQLNNESGFLGIPETVTLGEHEVEPTWIQIATETDVSAFYEGSALTQLSGWAFSYNTNEARNVCGKYEAISHNDNVVLVSYLYSMQFGFSNGIPVVAGLSELEHGRVMGAPISTLGHAYGENMH